LPVIQPPYVISCSRRTDVPACYTRWLAEALRAGVVQVPSPYGGPVRTVSLRPQEVHSFVFLSKNYRLLLADSEGARGLLGAYEQLFFHLTITGLGGGPLEPRVPPWREVAAQLPALVAWAGDARRVSLRYDPIVHWREGDDILSNLPYAEAIFDAAAAAGVRTVRVSIAALYPKVRRRLEWYNPGPEERAAIAARLAELARPRGLDLYACADPSLLHAGIRASACVDGALLARLHPRRLPAPTHKDPGQRPACGCTPSVDIASYHMTCPHACRYCYASGGGKKERTGVKALYNDPKALRDIALLVAATGSEPGLGMAGPATAAINQGFPDLADAPCSSAADAQAPASRDASIQTVAEERSSRGARTSYIVYP
jgi:hypothetical protein